MLALTTKRSITKFNHFYTPVTSNVKLILCMLCTMLCVKVCLFITFFLGHLCFKHLTLPNTQTPWTHYKTKCIASIHCEYTIILVTEILILIITLETITCTFLIYVKLKWIRNVHIVEIISPFLMASYIHKNSNDLHWFVGTRLPIQWLSGT